MLSWALASCEKQLISAGLSFWIRILILPYYYYLYATYTDFSEPWTQSPVLSHLRTHTLKYLAKAPVSVGSGVLLVNTSSGAKKNVQWSQTVLKYGRLEQWNVYCRVMQEDRWVMQEDRWLMPPKITNSPKGFINVFLKAWWGGRIAEYMIMSCTIFWLVDGEVMLTHKG